MEELNNEQTQALTQTEETEKDAQEVSLGKFKDVNSLLNAYNSLQAEFTKRCQRIKELESASKIDKEATPINDDKLMGESSEEKSITQQQKSKDEILKDYLKELISSRQQAIVMDRVGLSIKTPVSRPKTIAEAGLLAKDLLNQIRK